MKGVWHLYKSAYSWPSSKPVCSCKKDVSCFNENRIEWAYSNCCLGSSPVTASSLMAKSSICHIIPKGCLSVNQVVKNQVSCCMYSLSNLLSQASHVLVFFLTCVLFAQSFSLQTTCCRQIYIRHTFLLEWLKKNFFFVTNHTK